MLDQEEAMDPGTGATMPSIVGLRLGCGLRMLVSNSLSPAQAPPFLILVVIATELNKNVASHYQAWADTTYSTAEALKPLAKS